MSMHDTGIGLKLIFWHRPTWLTYRPMSPGRFTVYPQQPRRSLDPASSIFLLLPICPSSPLVLPFPALILSLSPSFCEAAQTIEGLEERCKFPNKVWGKPQPASILVYSDRAKTHLTASIIWIFVYRKLNSTLRSVTIFILKLSIKPLVKFFLNVHGAFGTISRDRCPCMSHPFSSSSR